MQAEPETTSDPTFEALNDRFRTAYSAMRIADTEEAPVLVLFAESLVLFRGSERVDICTSVLAVRALKAIAHLPVGIFVALHGARRRTGGQALDSPAREMMLKMRDAAACAARRLGELDEPLRADSGSVLQSADRFLERALAQGHVAAATLSAFATETGPLLLRVTEHATRLQLAALDAAVEKLLADLSPSEQAQLEVVVAGAHQARVRSLGLQYFQKRFGEEPGEERRVAYAESAVDAEEARALVGTRRLDRSIALAFFGDEKKLQRDVLGDVAKALLAEVELSSIGP